MSTTVEPTATKQVSAGRAVADLTKLARQRVIDADYWTPAEYRKAIAAYNRAVAAERRRSDYRRGPRND